MAASSAGDNCREKSLFETIAIQFFEMVPLRRIQLESQNMSLDELGIEKQQELLGLTVNSELCQQFPPSVQYQRTFMKKLLSLLEENGGDICDEMYETYTQLVQQGDMEEDALCYKTYTLGPEERVTVQESVNMVSYGTTGLCTWQAAQHLAEWAIQHADKINNRHVLELGCGLGMLGLAACRACQVSTYTFTDSHNSVLSLVSNNIQTNLAKRGIRITDSTDTLGMEDSVGDDSECSQSVKKVRHSYDEDVHSMHSIHSKNSMHSDSNARIDAQDSGDIEDDHFLKDSQHRAVSSDSIHVVSANQVDAGGDSVGVNDGAKQQSSLSAQLSVAQRVRFDRQISDSGDLNLRREVWQQVNRDLFVFKGDGKVRVGKLDWERMPDLLEHYNNTEVILAADVVYDTRIIPSLVGVLKTFLSKPGHPCVAYIASTIRNEDTRDQFLIALSTEGLQYEPVDPPTLKLFHYDTSVPIEIIKVVKGQGHSKN